MGEPKCLRIYFRGVFRVSTLAEVNKFFSGFVYSKFSSIFRIFFDKFKFERLTFEDFFGLGRSYFFSAEIKFLGNKFPHGFFKFWQISISDRFWQLEVVVETIFNHGPDSQLGLGNFFEPRHRKKKFPKPNWESG